MAKAPTNNERSEREFQLDVNQAVANTEAEIFDDALGEKPLENDGDTSLEEMGEGLEGQDLEEEDEAEEDAEEKGEEGEEPEAEASAEEAEGEEEEGEDDPEQQQRDEHGRFEDRERPDRREIPLRAERDRRRQAEERAAENERKLSEALGRIDELSRRVNAPPPQAEQQRAPRPDMFADPDGYDRWMREESRREAQEMVNQQMAAFYQQQQQQQTARVTANLEHAARGERGWEFGAAYNTLVNMDTNIPSVRALKQRIFDAPDPSRELFDWWDQNGGQEYREQVWSQLSRQNQGTRQRSPQPRHVTQIPESIRRNPPSLNSARGGQRHEIADPDMMDDSDEATFRFATRR